MRASRGISTAETAVMMTMIITGLVFMRIYVQRAIQGGLFSTASSLGMQFDPRDPYQERQHLTSSDTVHLVTPVDAPHGMVGAALLGGELDGGNASLPDLPTGPTYREPSVQAAQVSSTWSLTAPASENSYCEQRKIRGCL